VDQEEENNEQMDLSDEQKQRQNPPATPLPQWTDGSFNPYGQQEQQQQGWMNSEYTDATNSDNTLQLQPPPPSRQYYDYDQNYYPQQQQQQQSYGDSSYLYLQEELNESLSRESSLISQLDNLTTAVVVMEQREELHMRQLDVLTERIMDIEAQAAEDRNLLAEYEANCTALATTINALQSDLEQWQVRCEELAQRKDADEEKLQELRQAIKEKQSETEELAIAMEQLRMVEKRRESGYSGRHSKKKSGLFSWIFGFFGMGGTDDRYDDRIREESYEMAKSTLLRALQAERANVHELEAAVASLQQNNSAISEMVESRDIIIDELNNRVAVFEEDKVVLKAALRQLQKEMKEEAPKTQKLLDDLAQAEQEIIRLKADINSIILTHQDELATLQINISNKQKTITDAESNLTAIGTYVDKLEERLTSFAVTRRDMEEREKKCTEIEKAAEETEVQRQALQSQVEDYQKQQEDLKKLLEELASERANLQKENRKLYTEREFRIGEQEQLESKCKELETQAKLMGEELQEWKEKFECLVPEVEYSKQSKMELEQQLQSLDALHAEKENLLQSYEKVQQELASVKAEKSFLEEALANMTKAVEEKDAAEKAEKEAKPDIVGDDNEKTEIDEGSSSDDESKGKPRNPERRLPPPPPPRRQPFSKQSERKVPLRSLRKQLSKATGLHGLITPSSKMVEVGMKPSRPRPRIPEIKSIGRNPISNGETSERPTPIS
jgi:chromosome segregation ATPase